MNIEVKQIHSGQYRPYGDSFYVWQVETDCKDKEEILKYLRENLKIGNLPEEKEFKDSIKFGNENFGNPSYYFRGYYKLEEIGIGYQLTVCEPYCD